MTFPWINEGVPQVTAYSGNTNCRVSSWGTSPVVVFVNCTNNSGTAVDSIFNVTVNGR